MAFGAITPAVVLYIGATAAALLWAVAFAWVALRTALRAALRALAATDAAVARTTRRTGGHERVQYEARTIENVAQSGAVALPLAAVTAAAVLTDSDDDGGDGGGDG